VGKVIVAAPVSITNFNQRIYRYESNYFISPPQFGLLLAPQPQKTEYVIVNALGSDKINSFARFGMYPGDKIKITGTQNNNKTFTIKSITVNKDGSENIVTEESLTQESAFGNRVGIELIQTSKGTAAITPADSVVTLGACSIYKNGIKTSCFDDQTSDQCTARGSMATDSTFAWTANTTCSQTPSSIVTRVNNFTGQVNATNSLASLSSLGYFSSFNRIGT
jgi:hypothetical protein